MKLGTKTHQLPSMIQVKHVLVDFAGLVLDLVYQLQRIVHLTSQDWYTLYQHSASWDTYASWDGTVSSVTHWGDWSGCGGHLTGGVRWCKGSAWGQVTKQRVSKITRNNWDMKTLEAIKQACDKIEFLFAPFWLATGHRASTITSETLLMYCLVNAVWNLTTKQETNWILQRHSPGSRPMRRSTRLNSPRQELIHDDSWDCVPKV